MLEELRNEYKSFVYDNFYVSDLVDKYLVRYVYRLNDHVFMPEVTIAKKNINNPNIDDEFLKYLFFNFGMINAINYYKLTCSSEINVNCGYLDDEQKDFFKKLFYNGLGEYFYINNIQLSYEKFVTINTLPVTNNIFTFTDSFHGNLIPIGGGKDSIVTLELLKEYKDDNLVFMLERNIYPPNKAAYDSIYMAGYIDDNINVFSLTLDPLMLELNSKGFLNGHIPFSSCLAFAAYIVAYLTNKKYIVLSNEDSANEGNVKGTDINHQYSKSFEFERDFRAYASKYLCPKMEYFSLLRPWNEYRIVQEFLKYPKYLDVFVSCNKGARNNTWCSKCSKCLYVYIMLYPFVDETKLKAIFHQNMLDDMSLKDLFMGLVADEVDKPFECVGSKEEINYVLSLALRQKDDVPLLLKYYKDNLYNPNASYNVENYFNQNHYVPDIYLKLLEDSNER